MDEPKFCVLCGVRPVGDGRVKTCSPECWEAAEVCHAIKQENGDDPRVWLVDYMEECEQRILALAPPAAETVSHTITATSADGAKASPYMCDAPAAEPRDEGEVSDE